MADVGDHARRRDLLGLPRRRGIRPAGIFSLQFDDCRRSAEAVGRKLDFLAQEMNREINTIGSKADGLRVSELIITAKAELERMREQVQNVE